MILSCIPKDADIKIHSKHIAGALQKMLVSKFGDKFQFVNNMLFYNIGTAIGCKKQIFPSTVCKWKAACDLYSFVFRKLCLQPVTKGGFLDLGNKWCAYLSVISILFGFQRSKVQDFFVKYFVVDVFVKLRTLIFVEL